MGVAIVPTATARARREGRPNKMKGKLVIELTKAEAEQLLSYAYGRERDEGWYYGRRDQFEKRHESIKTKLETVLTENCERCEGSGKIEVDREQHFDKPHFYKEIVDCPNCDGTGKKGGKADGSS